MHSDWEKGPVALKLEPDNLRKDSRRRVTLIVSTYILFASAWIYVSDHALSRVIDDRYSALNLSTYKGLAFVFVTASLLYWLTSRALGAQEKSMAALREQQNMVARSQGQLSAIINTAQDAIIILDEGRRIAEFNLAAEKLFGTVRSQAMGRSIEDYLIGEVPKGATGNVFLCGRRSDGSEVPLEASISPIEQQDGPLVALIARDITLRQNHLAEIERLQRLYAALSQINQAIVWSPNREELLKRACQILVEYGGFCAAWISWYDEAGQKLVPVSMSVPDGVKVPEIAVDPVLPPEQRPPAVQAFLESHEWVCNDVANGLPSSAPLAHLKERFGSLAHYPIRFRGQACGILTICATETAYFQEKERELVTEAAMDISFALDTFSAQEQSRQLEENVRNEKLFSDTMVESMPGILYYYDTNGRFLRWNRNFETVSEFSGEEIAGMHPLDFFREEDRELLEERIGQVFVRGEATVEADFITKSGAAIPYFFTGRRVKYHDMECLVGVGIDVSAQRKAQEALQELNETLEKKVAERTSELEKALVRAEAADKLKSAFLATMSHELRTPLNSIIGFTGIILQGMAGPLTPEQSKQLNMVKGSANHLLALINDVLDISKIEAGQFKVSRDVFDLRVALERTVATVRPQAEKKGLMLACTIEEGLGRMENDRRRFEQILLNLLSNAIKFTEKGSVCIIAQKLDEYQFSPKEPPVPAVRIRVMDTGMGIKAEHLATLFQPFRQVDSGLTRQYDGTGLGLAICRRLATLMGGEITVDSEWERGSEFCVLMPLQVRPLLAEQQEKQLLEGMPREVLTNDGSTQKPQLQQA